MSQRRGGEGLHVLSKSCFCPISGSNRRLHHVSPWQYGDVLHAKTAVHSPVFCLKTVSTFDLTFAGYITCPRDSRVVAKYAVGGSKA